VDTVPRPLPTAAGPYPDLPLFLKENHVIIGNLFLTHCPHRRTQCVRGAIHHSKGVGDGMLRL